MNSYKKLYKENDLKNEIIEKKNKELIIGFTNGCFDLLHKGHLSLLSKSRSMCDYLIVGLNDDSSVKLLKGPNRPVDSINVRVKNLSELYDVDAIIIFSEQTPINIIEMIMPDILFKGSDYEKKNIIGFDCVTDNGGKVELIDIVIGYSTTKTINSKL
tara:strand:- start:335 stop:808 length:474 start_codon:yes stop_codon:yes gene_type:complete